MATMDVLIIGQGLAGTCLAFELLERGVSVTVIDDNHATASSTVGIATINPVTGRRYAKSWNIDALLPLVSDFYAKIGDLLGKTYLTSARIYQILPDSRTEENWLLRAADPAFQPYLDADIQENKSWGLHAFRFANIRNGYHLEMTGLLQDAAEWLRMKGVLQQDIFAFDNLNMSSQDVMYKGTMYSEIVFCEGHRVLRNPHFSDLEIYPMKGEYLICHIPGLGLKEHLKSRISIIPMPETDHYWCGSTYDRYNHDPAPTSMARDYILRHLEQLVQLPYTVVHQGVGIRATTRDRRPYVGTLRDQSHVHLVAGMGTKGASLAPYCAQMLADNLVNRKTIPQDIDISRLSLR